MQRFTLHHLALHYVGIRPRTAGDGGPDKERWRRLAAAPIDVDGLDPAVVDHLQRVLSEAWELSGDRAVHAARFDPDASGPRKLVRRWLGDLKQEVWAGAPANEARDRFFAFSRRVAERLYDATTLAASSGVVLFADVSPEGAEERTLALLKLRHRDESFTVLAEDLVSLEVEKIERLLTREILKGALWPHPEHPGYDLKLIDKQARDDDKPARYFTEEFLGCPPKDADARRVEMVQTRLPDKLAEKLKLKKDPDRYEAFVVSLEKKTEAQPEEIARIARQTTLPNVSAKELREAISKELGPRLPEIVDARKLEPELAELSEKRGWRYVDAQKAAFRAESDKAMRLDDKKVAASIVESGVVPGAKEPQVRRHLAETGGVDVPRIHVVNRGRTRRQLEYTFEVPREKGSKSFVKVVVRGPAVTLQDLLEPPGKDHPDKYVFQIEVPRDRFRRRYR